MRSNKEIAKKVLRYIKRYWFMVICSLILAAVTVVLTLYIPILTGHAIDLMVDREPGCVDIDGILKYLMQIGIVVCISAVAQWVMDMDWNYIAFGHYHKPGWIPGYEGKAAYCGSLENTVISGPDVCHRRGPVYVDLSADGNDRFVMHPQPIRRIVQLPDIDVADTDVNAEELDAMICERILDADVDGAIVLHTVRNIPRSVIKSMNRRSFQAVNPEMLYIKTKLEPLAEAPAAVKMNRHDDDEDDEIVGKSAEDAFKPLATEISETIDLLCSNGTIRESQKDEVAKIIAAFLD